MPIALISTPACESTANISDEESTSSRCACIPSSVHKRPRAAQPSSQLVSAPASYHPSLANVSLRATTARAAVSSGVAVVGLAGARCCALAVASELNRLVYCAVGKLVIRLATPTSAPHLSARVGTGVGVGVVATAARTSARRTSARQSGQRV